MPAHPAGRGRQRRGHTRLDAARASPSTSGLSWHNGGAGFGYAAGPILLLCAESKVGSSRRSTLPPWWAVLPDVSPVVRGGEMGPPMSVDRQPELRPSYLEHRAMRIDAGRLQERRLPDRRLQHRSAD